MKVSLLFIISVFLIHGRGWAVTTPTLGVTNIQVSEASAGETSYTFLSSAYNQEPAYSGLINEIDGATLTLDGLIGEFEEESYEDDELIETAHLLRLRDGNEQYHGMIFPVLGNSENEVIINLAPDDVAFYFSAGDSIDIIEANTLDGLFGKGEDFHGLAGTPSLSDNILIWTTYGWKTYFHHNDKWQTYGSRQDQGSTIIYPDEGLIYARRGTDSLTLSFSGYVPVVVQSYRPGPDGKFLMSNPFPVEVSLSQLIDISSNWAKSQDIAEADQILAWSGTAWVTYYHNESEWINSNTGALEDHIFQAGESFFIIRSNGFGNTAINQGYNKIDLPE